jgi:glycosyltransferase involved in cell wall biosynthesis
MIDKTEEQIRKRWQGDIANPKVTVCTITFNHKDFIEQSLDSFLRQETTFPFEIIVHDDLSTDGTKEIIEQYEKKYPNIIKPIYQKENQYSKGIRAISPIFVFPVAKGEYITLCEGDDYWNGVSKLEEQVNFLEKNPQYSVCYHNSVVVDEEDKLKSSKKNPLARDYSIEEMLLGETFILTNTIMFRKFTSETLTHYQNSFKEVYNGDMALMHQLAFMGKSKYLEEIEYAAYREHSGGVWSSINEVQKITNLYRSKRILEDNLNDYPLLKEKMNEIISNHLAVALSRILALGDLKSYKKVLEIIQKDNKLSLSSILGKHVNYMFSRIYAQLPFIKK